MKVDLKTNMLLFHGQCAHEVNDFEGNRLSVVYFTAANHANANEEDKMKLRTLSFPYPAADEDPYSLLLRPGGYGKQVAFKAGSKSLSKARAWNVELLAQRS